MKRILMISVGLAVALCARSQADVTSAYNANKQGDFAKAAEYIDKAITDPKAAGKEKTWRYRGDIYLNIAGVPDLSAQFPNAVNVCMESYAKSMELDTKKDYIGENSTGLSKLRTIVIERAINEYEAKDFCSAAQNFTYSTRVMEKLGVIDTAAIYNGAFSWMTCGKPEDALNGFQQCVKLGYGLPQAYSLIVELQQQLGRKDDAVKTLTDARQKYPKDAGLLRSEVNIYLADSNYTKAIEVLKALTVEEPGNEVVWLVLGSISEKLGNWAEEENAYLKALTINPNYYDALYNLGAAYYNKGNARYLECGNISFKEKAKFAECEKESNELYSKAVTQLELAYKVNPTNREAINALKEAYVRTGNMEGKKKMEEALGK